ncbi:MAG: hypothetical protein KVP17_002259 [Porospora cf. gigantea B]|uniref:uncharacterized protein n=1 Tax=Porospora cf. gigantea B TaxID=2853592 RepID=UPI003571C520|nr:MAG: hypothetical protein KVP17_002259 [Porospora cf. gigantea B]
MIRSEWEITVGNVPEAVTEAELSKVLRPFGEMDNVSYTRGSPAGEARVKYRELRGALNALYGLSNINPFESDPTFFLTAHFTNQYHAPPFVYPIMPMPAFPVEGAVFSPYYPTTYPTYHSYDRKLDRQRFYDERGPAGANLFVFHIPTSWNAATLRRKFEDYGDVVSVKLKTNALGQNIGYGFVSFSTREAAMEAIKAMHGAAADGKWLKVTLRKGEEHYMPADITDRVYGRDDRTVGPPEFHSAAAFPPVSDFKEEVYYSDREDTSTPPSMPDVRERSQSMIESPGPRSISLLEQISEKYNIDSLLNLSHEVSVPARKSM